MVADVLEIGKPGKGIQCVVKNDGCIWLWCKGGSDFIQRRHGYLRLGFKSEMTSH